jgi:hydrogenase nickel incorporation protein HypA/HybF
VHEYSIVSSLERLAEEHARKHGAGRVLRIEVSVGELSGVEVPLLETAWSLVRERSVCEAAALAVRVVPARWECPRCEKTVALGLVLRCEACELPAQLVRGDELVLERIEMEVA